MDSMASSMVINLLWNACKPNKATEKGREKIVSYTQQKQYHVITNGSSNNNGIDEKEGAQCAHTAHTAERSEGRMKWEKNGYSLTIVCMCIVQYPLLYCLNKIVVVVVISVAAAIEVICCCLWTFVCKQQNTN